MMRFQQMNQFQQFFITLFGHTIVVRVDPDIPQNVIRWGNVELNTETGEIKEVCRIGKETCSRSRSV